MKITTIVLMMAAVVASGDDRFSILESSGPELVDNGPVVLQQETTVLEKPAIIDQAAPASLPYSDAAPIILDGNFAPQSQLAPQDYLSPAPNHVCQSCQCLTCCCKPKRQRKVETKICLCDPRGCEHEACVCVPACCAGQTPKISWGRRLLGRQVATLCWACCDHEVKVVITRRGKVKVRD